MEIFIDYFIFSVGFNLFLFLIAFLLQTDKITDLSYSITFAAIAIYSFLQSEKSILDLIVLMLILGWAVRLGSYLFRRIHFMGRDHRFDKIREKFSSFFFFWLMQGLTCFIVSLPVIILNLKSGKIISVVFLTGIIIAVLGLVIETIADNQKFEFKTTNPSSFMNKGLWSIVQHPNYTGELMFWWGIFIASILYGDWYVAIIGPIWLSLIIIRFSGVSILQKNWKAQYGSLAEFQDYQRKTFKLIPHIY